VNLDDELRKLFSEDERLDVPLRDDAVSSVVSGARRIRRRRIMSVATSGTLVVAGLAGATIAFANVGAPESLPPVGQETVGSTTSLGQLPTTDPGSPSQSSSPTASNTIVHKTPPPSTTTTAPPPKKQKAPIGPSGYGGLALGMSVDQAESTGMIMRNADPVSSEGCIGYDYKGAPNEPKHYSVLISPKLGVVRIAGRADSITPEGLWTGAPESDLKRLYPTQSGTHGVTGEWVAAVPDNAEAQYWIIVRNESVAEIRIELKTQDCYQ
jgi:hypothetical protein